MGQTNEQFGALGLGSSSVREAQLADQASQLSQAVGEEGLRAGVGAQEAATNRSLGAFNPALGASGQSLAADQSAFAGQLGARQFGQQGSLGGLSAGLGAANLGENARQFESGLQQQANQFNALQGGQPAPSFGGGAPSILRRHSLGGRAFARGGIIQQPSRVQQVSGPGRPVNGRDHLTQLMFGQTFETPQFNPVRQESFAGAGPPRSGGFQPPVGGLVQQKQNFIPDPMSNPVNLQRRLAEDAMRRQLQLARISGQAEIQAAGPRQAALTDPGSAALNLGMQNLGFDQSGSQIFGPAISAMAQTAAQGQADQGAMQRQQAHQQFILDQLRLQGQPPVTGAGPGIGPGMNDGGEVPGPAVPPDVVPAEVNGGQDVMLQGGELVVPVGLRSEIEMDQSGHPTIEKLKGLVGKPPEMGMQDGGIAQQAQAFKGKLRGGSAFEVLTGMRPEDIAGARQQAAVQTDFGTNAPSHAAATEAITQRFGPNFAQTIGALQEVPSGLGTLRDKPEEGFFTSEGESGFSIPDIVANAAGANRASPLNAPAAGILGLAGLLGGDSPSGQIAQEAIQGQSEALGQAIMGLLDRFRPNPDQRGGTEITSPQAGAPPRGQTGFDTRAPNFFPQPLPSDEEIMGLVRQAFGVQFDPAAGTLSGTLFGQPQVGTTAPAPGRTSPETEARTLETTPEMQQHASEFGQAAAEPAQAPATGPIEQFLDPDLQPGAPAPEVIQQPAESPFHRAQRGSVSELGVASEALPGDQELLTAQRRATTLHNLALQSPPGSRIQQMAQEAVAKAEGLSSKRQAISEQRNALQQAMKQALAEAQFSAQAAAIPATIAAQGGLQREQLRQGAMDERKTADLQARASSKILEIAIKAATQLGTFDQNIFNQVLTALAGADPSTLAGGEGSAGDEALEMIRQQVEPSILDNNPL